MMSARAGQSGPANSRLVIRSFNPGDVTPISDIVRSSPQAALWSAAGLLDFAKSGGQVWVAENGDILVGFLAARCVAGECEILNFAVDPDYRRRGIGGALVQMALDAAKNADCTHVHLEVRASNQPAVALYAAHGFQQSGRRPRYYQHPEEDALMLSLHVI